MYLFYFAGSWASIFSFWQTCSGMATDSYSRFQSGTLGNMYVTLCLNPQSTEKCYFCSFRQYVKIEFHRVYSAKIMNQQNPSPITIRGKSMKATTIKYKSYLIYLPTSENIFVTTIIIVFVDGKQRDRTSSMPEFESAHVRIYQVVRYRLPRVQVYTRPCQIIFFILFKNRYQWIIISTFWKEK